MKSGFAPIVARQRKNELNNSITLKSLHIYLLCVAYAVEIFFCIFTYENVANINP